MALYHLPISLPNHSVFALIHPFLHLSTYRPPSCRHIHPSTYMPVYTHVSIYPTHLSVNLSSIRTLIHTPVHLPSRIPT